MSDEKMKRVALYARSSSTEASLEQQLEATRQMANEQGWAVSDECVDQAMGDGEIGDLGPKLVRLMTYTRHLDSIVVQSLDRLSRDPRVLEIVVNFFRAMNVAIVSVEPMATQVPQYEFIADVVKVINTLERKAAGDRVRRGRAEAARRRATI